MRRWRGDLALGLRLAVGGRSSLTRFAISTVGIAIGVAVLLFGASVGNLAEQNQARAASDSGSDVAIDGVDPLYRAVRPTYFRGERIELVYVYADGDNFPLPKGVERLPAPGEVLASPALAELLASPEGELLRPRFAGEIIGTLGREQVVEPDDLRAYVGADAGLATSPNAHPVYLFDGISHRSPLPPMILLILLVGVAVLLVPVFVFVSSSSRVAGVDRDRRLAALRLVGSDSAQVRRIAAAEGVISALAGLVAGAGLFLFGRLFAEEVELFGRRVYTEDVVPNPVLTALIVLAVPVLAVGAAQFSLRRTVIEPLGVVRHAQPVRRRGAWRFALVAAGVALLATGGGAAHGSTTWLATLVVGTVLLLVGVPVLLPWLVERVVRRIGGGPVSWQLAIRRLQLDSGTSARVVGGIAVVLAGAIALQTIVLTSETELEVPPDPGDQQGRLVEVLLEEPGMAQDVAEDLTAEPAVRSAHVSMDLSIYEVGSETEGIHSLDVMDCDGVRAIAAGIDCTDGDVFTGAGYGELVPEPGARLEFREYAEADGGEMPAEYEVIDTWTVPPGEELPRIDDLMRVGGLIVTPGALAGVRLPELDGVVVVDIGRPSADDLERIRNAIAPYSWKTHLFTFGVENSLTRDQRAFVTVRNGLYAGAVFTLLLAGLTLLVLALEQLRERRRPLAVLVATGVPRAVLARSLLWQVVLPIVIGVVVAVASGVGLAWLVLRALGDGMTVDWLGVGLLSAGAVVLAVVVSALTLPFLRSATRLTSLRTE